VFTSVRETGEVSTPAVSVIVPARDAAPTIRRTIESLRAQRLGAPFEVIVVDDGSQDETPTIVRAYEPLARLIRSETSNGPGRARNRGVAASRAPVLAFTDADCYPVPEWLACGLAGLAHADLVQGRVEPDPATPRTPFDRSLSVESDSGLYQTANLFLRRELFDAVGGFRDWALEDGTRRWSVDRRRGRGARTPIGEDTLFAWQARRRGARSAFASAAIVHHAVVPGGVRDDIADRWHWARDMPGLARLVPELRDEVFYRRWFFAEWSARFDLALAAALLSAVTGRKLWLLAAIPYAQRLRHESGRFRTGEEALPAKLAQAATFALGASAVDAATLAGLAAGSVAWRSLVL
jgi:glycosyltransferase involved in cell wall biosynthesis